MRSTAMSFRRRSARPLLALGIAVLVFTGAARACEMPPPPCPGAMFACPVDDNIPAAFCPLEHTDVRAEIAGDIARVTVTQRFRNTLGSAIEAIYTFPLSEKGAVDRMQMKIGDRIITGKVKEREEARRDYERARHEGRTAALLDQERPNIFTQSVANVQPGDVIEVNISYVEYLKHEADDYEFSFPMTVGPRYMPGGPLPSGAGTTQPPDAGKISPPLTPEGTRAGHDVSLEVFLDAGMPLGELKSELHKVAIERPSEARAVIRLENQKELPNRDFVLKYSVRGAGIREGVLTHKDKRAATLPCGCSRPRMPRQRSLWRRNSSL
jgi:Ca-activated chloride channel family protein